MSYIILVLALAGIVWSLVFAVRGSVLGGCVAYLIAACCFSQLFWSFDAVGFTWSIDRFLLALMMGLFVVQWRMGRIAPKPYTLVEPLLGCFLGLVMVSTFTHNWRASGPHDESPLIHLINGYLIPIVIFFLAKHAKIEKRDLHLAYGMLGLFGIYLATTAIFEITGQWALVFPGYIADAELGIHFGRARGPMLQAARLGTYLLACAGVTIALLCDKSERYRWVLLAAVPLGVLYILALYGTYTRSVWLGTVLALLVGIGFAMKKHVRVFLFATAALGALLALATKGDQMIAFKRETSAQVTRQSTYMRASFAYVSWKMFLDKPLTGFGFRQFREESKHYLDDRQTTLQLEQIRGYIHHNTILSLLVELGILGPVLFLALLLSWVHTAWGLWKSHDGPAWARAHGLLFLSLFAVYSLQLLFREVSYSPIENALLFFMAGVACSLAASEATAPNKSAWPSNRWNTSTLSRAQT